MAYRAKVFGAVGTLAVAGCGGGETNGTTAAFATTISASGLDGGGGDSGTTSGADDGSTGGGGDGSTTGAGDDGGGSATGSDDCSAAPSYDADIQPVWDTYCTTACHEAGGEVTTLILTAPSYDNIVNAPSTQIALSHVKPGNLDKSYLWAKLQGTQTDIGGLGVPMPKPHIGSSTSEMLTAEQMMAIQTWIVCNAPM